MVYVDDMYTLSIGRFGRMKMSHMIADNSEELIEMAAKIGVDSKWIQYPGQPNEHFDISLSKRRQAVLLGAKEITYRELGEIIWNRRKPFTQQNTIAP